MEGKYEIPARYVFVAVTILGSFLQTIRRSSMTVAITGMVKTKSSANSNSTFVNTDVCPISNDSTTSSTSHKEGEFDWDEVTQGYILTSPIYGVVCTILIGVHFTRGWSPKKVIAIISISSSILHVLTPVVVRWNVTAFIVLRALEGLISGPGIPLASGLSASWIPPDERQQLSGIMLSASAFGGIFSSAISGVLVDTYGWELIFYLFGGLLTIHVIMWWFLVYDTPQDHPRISEEEKKYIQSSMTKEHHVKFPVPWVKMVSSLPVWAHVSMDIAVAWLSFMLGTELPTYLKHILHYNTTSVGLIAALPSISSWLSHLFFGIFSQWLRRKGYVSHLTAYRIFNAIATIGPAAAILVITQIGCDAPAIIALLAIITFCSGAFVGGSMLNHMDLAINFVPALSGFSATVTGLIGIISPTITSYIINNQQTLTAWSKVFYITAAVSAIPYLFFFFFGSVEEQIWNKPIKPKDERNIPDKEDKHHTVLTVESDDSKNLCSGGIISVLTPQQNVTVEIIPRGNVLLRAEV